MTKPFDREKYLSIGFNGVKSTTKSERAPREYPYVSSTLPRKGDPKDVHKGRYSKKYGKPIIENAKQEDHITGASNGRYTIV